MGSIFAETLCFLYAVGWRRRRQVVLADATFGLDYNGVFPFDSRDAMGVRAPRVPCSERTQAVKTTQTAQACCH